MTREAATEVAQSFIGPAAGAFALAVWPVLGKLDYGVLVMDMRNGDIWYMLDDADVTRFREVLAA